ncbi:uncharacterized protein LOC116053426 [Sander lucioperca]|uniref:uncharacterized protein LOC116053426 n=1 Tax=Sander lucioperca TaxID=283035 RepID=UPI0016536259|nr:uncharacterized protein LOC116053426 [Sander lucioperca]
MESRVHISVFKKNNTPQVTRCTVCCTDHHCPLCPTSIYKPRCRAKVLQHMEVHVKNGIQHEDFFITKCHWACRSGSSGHFHCPFCLKTTIKRQAILRHLQICRPPLHDAQLDADADCREMGINSQTEECKAGSVNLPHLSTDKLPVPVHDSEIQGQRDPAKRPQDPPMDNPPCSVSRAKLPNVLCPHCNVQFRRKNIKKHIYRQHTDKAVRDITANSHLDAVCIDEKNGIYAVKKLFLGPFMPLHVQKKTWGKEHQIKCESRNIVLGPPVLITSQAQIVSLTGVLKGLSTYCKECGQCGMLYRYQEYKDGLHNFDDGVILTFNLCMFLRNSLQH